MGGTSKRFADFLPWAGMIEEGVVITKDAVLLRTVKVRPNDLSFLDDGAIINMYQVLLNTFRFISNNQWVIHINSVRRKEAVVPNRFRPDAPEAVRAFEERRAASLGESFISEHYLTYGMTADDKHANMKFGGDEDQARGIKRKLYEFLSITNDIINLLKSVFLDVQKLTSDETLAFYHSCISEPHQVKTPPSGFYLDYYLSDQLFVPDTITKLDDHYIKTLSVHDFPSATRSDMVTRLMALPLEFRFSVRFIFLERETAKQKIKYLRKSQYQKRKGVGAMLAEAVTKEQTALEDTEALAQTEESSRALASLASGETAYGYLTTTVIKRESSYEKAADDLESIKKTINEYGYVTKEETLNNPFAFLGSLPGNIRQNPRKPLISTRNLAHFFPLSESWRGTYTNEHLEQAAAGEEASCPHVIAKTGNTVFYLNLNVGDVGHTLVIGPTGAGKSILLNTLALQFLRYRGARIIFFDKDRSSECPCRSAGGLFYDVGGENGGILFNPFDGAAEKSHRIFLSEFFSEYLRSRGIPVSPKDQTEILEALDSMQGMEISSLNFSSFQSLVQNEDIRAAFAPFTDGEYAPLFGSVKDAISDSPFITYEMNALMGMGADIVRFILGYLFYRLQKEFCGAPTLLILDEAWLFLDNDYFAKTLRNWLKTLRKKNVYVIIATQEVADSRESAIFSTIINACQTKIILPNPQAEGPENRKLYYELGLSDSDIYSIARAAMKREYLYFSSKGKQIFDLRLDEAQLKILKTTTGGKET